MQSPEDIPIFSVEKGAKESRDLDLTSSAVLTFSTQLQTSPLSEMCGGGLTGAGLEVLVDDETF